jgi:hypothetical protein
MKRLLLLSTVVAVVCGGSSGFAQITPAWTPIGPRGDLLTAEESFGYNGRVRSIQIVPFADSFRVYIGACGGGVWRAFGVFGPAWTDIGDQLPNPSIGALAVNPANADDILVGTGDEGALFITGGQGLYHTTDAATWYPVDFPVVPQFVYRLLYLPGTTNVILAATSFGLYRTTNGPDGPWSRVSANTNLVSDLVIDPNNPQIQFCAMQTTFGSDGGIYRSTDGGISWSLVSASIVPANNFGEARIAICRDSATTVAFVFESGGKISNNGISGIALSTNRGTNWSNVTPGIAPGSPAALDTEGLRALAITFRPNNPQEIIVAANNIWWSRDGGQTWLNNTNGADVIKPHQDIAQLYFSSSTGDNILWQCSDGGVFQVDLTSNAKMSWNGPTDGASSLQISTVADMDALRLLSVIGNQDDQTAATSDDSTWTSVGAGDCYAAAITQELSNFPLTPTYWYIKSSGSAGQARKVRIGSNKEDFTDGTVLTGLTLFYNRFEDKLYSLDVQSNLVSRAASASGSNIWTLESSSPFVTGPDQLRGNRVNGQTLYLFRSFSPVLTVLGQNAGVWSIVRTNRLGTTNNGYINDVFASTEWPGRGWAAMTGQPAILYTSDDWQTWTTNVSGNLGDVSLNAPVNTLVVMPFDPNTIFAGTDRGVFITQDGGQTWQPFQTGMPISKCSRLRFVTDYNHSGNNMLVAATFGRGLYETPISRAPLVYVDPRYPGVFPFVADGSFEHPLNDFNTGLSTTPSGGVMALDGARTYITSGYLNKPMQITAYEFPAFLTH